MRISDWSSDVGSSDLLLDALDRGTLRAAGLDVFEVEPLPSDSPLIDHPKVLALPHVGSATHETRLAMSSMATSNLLLALQRSEERRVGKEGVSTCRSRW